MDVDSTKTFWSMTAPVSIEINHSKNLEWIEFKCGEDKRLIGGWCQTYESITLVSPNGETLRVKIPKRFMKK